MAIQLSLGAGFPILPPKNESKTKLIKNGLAVPLKNNEDEWFIVQKHVQSYSEYDKAVKDIIYKHKDQNLSAFFRGQPCDYYDTNGFLSTLPAALRTTHKTKEYFDREKLADILDPWLSVLLHFGIDCSTKAGFYVTKKGFAETYIDKSAQAGLYRNHLLMAIAMHYGLETPFLDVTSDANIALWFALHKAKQDKNKHIYFKPSIPSSKQSDTYSSSHIPSVQVFLQWINFPVECPIVNLTKIKAMKNVAKRPYIQRAVALPFRSINISPGLNTSLFHMPVTVFIDHFRYPSIILKINFDVQELYKHLPQFNADVLFPKDEKLYKELMRAGVPGLALYR